MTKYVVDYFRTHRPGALDLVLARAEESRGADALADEATWSSYDQLRRLLVAASDVLGGAGRLNEFGPSAMQTISAPDLTSSLQDLGSPSLLYSSIGSAADALSTIVDMSSEEISPTEWIVTSRFCEGFDPFPEFCALAAGLISVPPMLFGLDPAEVVEELCQANGAGACRFRVRWRTVEGWAQRAEYLRVRLEVAEARLRAIQSTVGVDPV